ncbi:MAG: acetyl-CoA acetyltransferase [Alphaproteobacteria bacterium]
MSAPKVYLLGGYQTDFKRNFAGEKLSIHDMMREAVDGAMRETGIEPVEIQAAHVGNAFGELFVNQAQLGGFFASLHPEFSGLPSSRHEGACASGSLAGLGAQADIQAGHYDLVAVVGVEMMRNVSSQQAADNMGTAAWVGREAQDAQWLWPYMFAKLGDEYERRYGLKREYLAGIAKLNFANAKRNPNAQTRAWKFTDASFADDDAANPRVEGRIRKQDCGQITDGGICVFLASEAYAADYAKRQNIKLADIPYIKGWGHRTATMLFADKLKESHNGPYVLPHVRGTITDAHKRAGLGGVEQIDAIETHDCFTTTEYMAIDHFGITKPGESWKAVEDGRIAGDGAIPVNPSGGLIGAGHPVGATGVRMLLDAYKQTTGTAGDYQVNGCKTLQTLNIGGSGTTTVSFIVSTAA